MARAVFRPARIAPSRWHWWLRKLQRLLFWPRVRDFAHTMTNLATRDLGFETRQLLVVEADPPAHSGQDAERRCGSTTQLFPHFAALPGVQHVAGIMGLPIGTMARRLLQRERRNHRHPDHDHAPWANCSVASPGYFRTMGIPLKRDATSVRGDLGSSQFVAIISESLARQSFGNADPIGRQIRCGLDSDKRMTVIGVAGDVRQESPAEKPGPTLYMPMSQHPFYAIPDSYRTADAGASADLDECGARQDQANQSANCFALHHYGCHG